MRHLGIGKTIFGLIKDYEQLHNLENNQDSFSKNRVNELNAEISGLEQDLEAQIMELIESNIDINITADVRI